MDLKKFKQLRENYEKYVDEAEHLMHRDHPQEQTRSIWFERHRLEELLKATDPEKGGIRIYFGRYDSSTLPELDDEELSKQMDGRLTVILAASDDNAAPKEEEFIINNGWFCPPHCG